MATLTRWRGRAGKYAAITTANLQNQLAYIWDALNRAFFIVIIMFIFVQLWTAAYASQDATEIAGMTLANTIWYFLIAEMVELSKMRHDQKITAEVKDGSIAYTLIRPYNYLGYHFFNGLGETALKLVLIFFLGLPIVLFYAGPPDVAWWQLPLVGLVMFLALLLSFLMVSMIGLLAFVTEDTQSFYLIYQKLVFILGGLLIPVNFLPEWLERIALALPFQLMTYAPAKLFVAFTWEEFGRMMGSYVIWFAIIGGALWLHYRWMVRRLAVNGG